MWKTRDERSFAEVVSAKEKTDRQDTKKPRLEKSLNQSQKTQNMNVNEECSIIKDLKEDPEMKSTLQRCLVAKAKKMEMLEDLSAILQSLCPNIKGGKFLGGTNIPIICDSKETAEAIARDKSKEIWEWVENIRLWSKDYSTRT